MKKIISMFLLTGFMFLNCISYSMAQITNGNVGVGTETPSPDSLVFNLIAVDADTLQAVQSGTTKILMGVKITNNSPNNYGAVTINVTNVGVENVGVAISQPNQVHSTATITTVLLPFSSNLIYVPNGGLSLGSTVSTKYAIQGNVSLTVNLSNVSPAQNKNSVYASQVSDMVYIPSANMDLIPVISNQVNNLVASVNSMGASIQNFWNQLTSMKGEEDYIVNQDVGLQSGEQYIVNQEKGLQSGEQYIVNQETGLQTGEQYIVNQETGLQTGEQYLANQDKQIETGESEILNKV